MQRKTRLVSATGASGHGRTDAHLGAPTPRARILAVGGTVLTGLPLVAGAVAGNRVRMMAWSVAPAGPEGGAS